MFEWFSWLPPEVLRDNAYSTKSDTWSLGVVFYEIWTNGSRPYSDLKNNMEVKKFVLNGQILKPPEGEF